MGDYSGSLSLISQVLSSLPDLSEGYFILGKVYQKMNDFARSVTALEASLRLAKRGHRLELVVPDLLSALYDAYVGLSPPDHTGGMRTLEQTLALYPTDLQQLFSFYHIKQYISSLHGLVPLRRRAVDQLLLQKEKYMALARKGEIPPLTPIRASVMLSMEIQKEVNALYQEYILSSRASGIRHRAIRGKSSRAPSPRSSSAPCASCWAAFRRHVL